DLEHRLPLDGGSFQKLCRQNVGMPSGIVAHVGNESEDLSCRTGDGRGPGCGEHVSISSSNGYLTLLRVKPPSWTGMNVVATAGSSHLASSVAKHSETRPEDWPLIAAARLSNAVAKCFALTFMWNSIDAESG